MIFKSHKPMFGKNYRVSCQNI